MRLHRLVAFALLLPMLSFTAVQAQTRANPEPAQTTVRVVVARANIRVQPNAAAQVLTTVPAGTILTAVRREGDWVEVRFSVSGGPQLRGFVSAPLVETIQTTEDPVPTKPVQAPAAPQPERPPVAPSRPPTDARAPVAPIRSSSFEIEKQQWSMRLATAHEDVGNAKKIMWAGVGFAGVGLLLRVVSTTPSLGGSKGLSDPTLDSFRPNVWLANLSMITGGGVAVYGFVKGNSAQHRVETLNQDGRAKGFAAAIGPTGAKFTYTFTF